MGSCYKTARGSSVGRRGVPGAGSATATATGTWPPGGVSGVAWESGTWTAAAPHGSGVAGTVISAASGCLPPAAAALVVAMPTWTASAVQLGAEGESESQTWTAGRCGVAAGSASASCLMSKIARSGCGLGPWQVHVWVAGSG